MSGDGSRRRPRVPVNGFVLGLFLALGLAVVLPEPGARGGLLRAETTTLVGVFVIFFLQGLVLPSEEIRRDLMEWRLHVFIQGYQFVLIPLLALGLDLLVGGFLHPDLRFGFLYLAMLPTTITTAVVFSTAVGGNAAAAIFNTSLANLLGIFIVPAWAAWLLSAGGGLEVPVGPLLAQLARLLALPMALGQAARFVLVRRIRRPPPAGLRRAVGKVNTGIVFFILYATTADSVARGVWEREGAGVVWVSLAGGLLFLLLVKAAVWAGALRAGFAYPSRMTAFFCASQKTLAAGVPMGTSILAAAAAAVTGGAAAVPEAGIALLPLMAYHVLQLLLGGLIVSRLEGRGGGGGAVDGRDGRGAPDGPDGPDGRRAGDRGGPTDGNS